ncbi:MAG: MoaD/ThiS family protein [Fimbriimonadaceae bacterium]
MKRVSITYYAIFREQRGLGSEELLTSAASYGDLYDELRARHGFTLDPSLVRSAVNGAFVPKDQLLCEGDAVVFIPPVAGG